ncbi:ESCRT-II complex subunit VPS36 [Marchantia polymorpha subsp. ruderalis]|uniref:Vacuolar protein-sorting-associated protein 36 n=2 Tax=Marchantia polymorpha TaxID=3197 RepID=A0A176VEF5_MARPO|nr:hypothetical protein AXG93_1860s1380 [Marchantia polymorpha subsp. ruderalis]PTQ35266.1 hypothetical protein MARPO_0072s0023 [Marchantia polymorpha]BBN03385.1 hypothetical protein Mp_2g23080 [Marchantia polymorpha subsp. ruderalis]|eukprot:PTQ35266.1 hypothetical protein MARPO_0072s0023 [Marchantia polymorpha]
MDRIWAEVLRPAQLTGAGRPIFHPNEIECQLVDGVEMQLETVPNAPSFRNVVVILTTHRIVCVDENSKNAGAIALGAVCRVFPPKKTLKSMFVASRMRIQLWTKNGSVADGANSATESAIVLVMIFRGQTSSDSFISKLGEVIEAKAWEADIKNVRVVAQQSIAGGPAGNSHSVRGPADQLGSVPLVRKLNPAMAGVSGILRKEKEQLDEADKNLQEAFSDLNALMSKAKEMVSLAERMRIKLLAAPSQQMSAADDEEMGKQEMQDWLLSVGIVSPVTKESAGALYHQQLARQLADFVKVPLQKSGGMLAMVDVYCLFNRARGTELISPEDLLQACTIWASIDVPVAMRRFDSGVVVIQSKSHNDEEVSMRLEILVKQPDAMRQGISATDAARALGLAPALAKEHLLAAEMRGQLCRDDGADGLRFFLNILVQVDITKAFQ